jgi:hypothetical protein
VTLCGQSAAIEILTAELSAVSLIQALNAISVTLDPPIMAAVESVTEYFDVLREYRNYYVHGIRAIGIRSEVGVGLTFMASAKGKLRYAEDHVTSHDLNTLKTQAQVLTKATVAILDTVFPRQGSQVNPPLPSTETFPPPDRLKKTLRYPLNEPLPRQS